MKLLKKMSFTKQESQESTSVITEDGGSQNDLNKELWRKEKEEATQAFQQERKKYEDQIETLQKQVMEQSMTMSMMSSVTPDDFNHDDDLYGN